MGVINDRRGVSWTFPPISAATFARLMVLEEADRLVQAIMDGRITHLSVGITPGFSRGPNDTPPTRRKFWEDWERPCIRTKR